MSQSFDLIVIGSGSAATGAATTCAKAGLSVAMIDKRPIGGTCALRGCDPKKMLRRGAEIIESASLLRGQGISGPGPRIDWGGLVARKDRYTGKVPGNKRHMLEQKGIAVIEGVARFTGRDTLEVGERELRAGKFLVAAGSVARSLGIAGEEHLLDNEEFMALEELPPRILFVGGGYISFEFAHIAARAGSEVIIADHGEHPLHGFDPDLVEKLVERSREAGIALQRNANIKHIQRENGRFAVPLETQERESTEYADLVVHGAGRAADLEELDLKMAGVSYSHKGVEVDAHLRSTGNAHIYAAGDAADTKGPPLTPVAGIEGRIAAKNILGEQATPNYAGVASVVFTLPELAKVGLLEAEAEAQGIDFDVIYTDTSGWFSNLRVAESVGATKVLIEKGSDRIVGAHMLGHGYAETINFFALAIRLGLTRGQLSEVPMAYPTIGSDLSSML